MAVEFEVEPSTNPNCEVRLRAFASGFQVTFRESFGWRCRCGKNADHKLCKHVRAVVRELSDAEVQAIERAAPAGLRVT